MKTSPTLPQNFVTDTWVKATWEEFMEMKTRFGAAYHTIAYKNLLKSKPPSGDSSLNLSLLKINKIRSE